MFNSGYSLQHNNKLNPYLVKEILDATPQQLIIKVYDFAIVNCQKKNIEKTNKAIQELINALRFDDERFREFSIGLLNLYHFCQEEVRNRNFETAQRFLTELRESWLSNLNIR